MSRLAIVRETPVLDDVVSAVESAGRHVGEGCGAVCTFLGVVRSTHKGRRVRHLEDEAFEELALSAFSRIETEIAQKWPGTIIALHHRIGRLAVGEVSVAIAVAAAHRHEAFQASRYAIERVKQIAPIWKHEFFEDGEAWVEGAQVDPDDESARQEALSKACA